MKQQRLTILLITAFLLGNYRGQIALWKTGIHEPLEVFPYPVSSLPVPDQNALNRGIYLEDEQALHAILEDYLS